MYFSLHKTKVHLASISNLITYISISLSVLAITLLPSDSLASRSQEVVKIGTVFPMTGPTATFGQESMNGIKLALKKIKMDQKIPIINLINEDNKGEPTESANAVRKLTAVNKVHAILGSVASSNTLAGAPVAQGAQVPMLTPASTNIDITKQGNFISRTCFIDSFQGPVMAKFAINNLKAKKAVLMIDSSSDYSKGLEKAFRGEFEKLGGKIVGDVLAYQQKDTDFRSLLRKLKRSRPDVVYLPGYYTEVGLILKQAREMGIKTPFLGGDGWDSYKLQNLAGTKGIKGNYLVSHFSSQDSDPLVVEFVKDYIKQYKEKPGAMAALGYDAMLVMADALKRAKDLSHKSIQEAIVATKDFQGVTGKITIDENRNAKKSAVVLETTFRGNIFKAKIQP